MTGLPEYVRTFTAVLLEREIREAIAREAGALLEGAGRVSVVRAENLHVTLKFLGDVHRDDLPAVHEVVADAAARLAEGEVEVAGIDAFPGLGRPRVLWAGVSDPRGILTPVHDRLNETLAGLGVKREKKRYVPHVTIARVRGPFDAPLVRERIERAGELWFGSQRVGSVALLMSEIRRGEPPRYTVMGRYGPGGQADGEG